MKIQNSYLTRFAELLLAPPSRPHNVRVRHVPDNMTKSDLQENLTKLWKAVASIHSLARDTLHGQFQQELTWRQCATVTFPAITNEKVEEHVKDSETRDTKLSGQNSSFRLAYDMNFMGVTPLYDGDKALVEYALFCTPTYLPIVRFDC